MEDLGFHLEQQHAAYKQYFQTARITTRNPANNFEVYLAQLEDFITHYLFNQVEAHRGLKIFPQMEIVYEKHSGETISNDTVPLSCKFLVIYNQSDIRPALQTFTQELRVRNENLLRLQSLVNMVQVSFLDLHLAEQNPISTGSTYVELPRFLENKKCIVNVKNLDERCFGYAVLSALANVDRKNHANDPSHYAGRFGWRGLDKIHYPVAIGDIPDIEKQLEIGFNVYSFYDDAGRARYPLHICKNEYEVNIDLLFWNGHYAWIKNFGGFMHDLVNGRHTLYFCRKCLGHFFDEEKLTIHSKYCHPTEGRKQVIQLPSLPTELKFKNYRFQQRIPFVIYADFECIVPQTNKLPPAGCNSIEYQHHIPCSIGLKLVSTVPQLSNLPFKSHFGPDSTEWLLKELENLERLCIEWLFKDDRMIFTPADRKDFEEAAACYVCHKAFG